MSQEINLENKKFVHSKEAAKAVGYVSDYVGQLCRSGEVECQMIGRTWFVNLDSILTHHKQKTTNKASRIFNIISGGKAETVSQRHVEELASLGASSETAIPSLEGSVHEETKAGQLAEKIIIRVQALKDRILSSRAGKNFGIIKPAVNLLYQYSLPLIRSNMIPSKEVLNKLSALAFSVLLVFGVFFAKDTILAKETFERIEKVLDGGYKFVLSTPEKIKGIKISSAYDFIKETAYSAKKLALSSGVDLYNETRKIFSNANIFAKKVGQSVYEFANVYAFSAISNPEGFLSALSEDLDGLIKDSYFGTKKFLTENFHETKENVFAFAKDVWSDPLYAGKNLLSIVRVKIYPSENNSLFSLAKNFTSSGLSSGENILASVKSVQGVKPDFEKCVLDYESRLFAQKSLLDKNRPPKDDDFVVTGTGKIVERITEKVVLAGGVSRDEFENRLADMNARLSTEIYRVQNATGGNTTYINNVYHAVSQTNKIDKLTGVDIYTPTISGGSISDVTITGSSFSGTSVLADTGTFNGNLSLGGQLTVSGTATSTFAGDSAFDSNTLYIDSLNNRVGVGSSSPTDTFSVAGPVFLSDISPSITGNRLYSNSGTLYWSGNVVGGSTVGVWTSDGTNAWRPTGNVGIGSTSPFAKLSVAGNGYFDGNIIATDLTATGTATVSGLATLGNLLLTGSSTLQNFTFENATGTNATTTSLFTSVFRATTSIFDSIISTLASFTGLTADRATTTYATSTNLYAGSATIGNLSATGSINPNIGSNMLVGTDSSGNLTSTSSPQIAYINATSTTATSTFAGGLKAGGSTGLYVLQNGKVGVGTATPQANLQVGNWTNNSVDTNILSSREVNDTASGNAHGFSDSSNISRSGTIGYAAYDSRVTFSGANDYDHFVSLQSAPTLNGSGTFSNFYGVYTTNTINSGTVTNNYGMLMGNPTGAGTITNNYGLYVQNQTKGTTKNYAIFTEAGAPLYFGDNVTVGGHLGVGASWNAGYNLYTLGGAYIASSTSGGEKTALVLANQFAVDGTASALGWNVSSNATTLTGKIVNKRIGSGNYGLSFQTYGGSGLMDAMNIVGSGNVGIGSTSPTNRLGVSGGFIDVDGTTGGYKIDNRLILQASSTNQSVLVGEGAGASLLADGIQNTALGYQALYIATSSAYNTAMGYRSLYSHTTGTRNSAYGVNSLYSNTTGSFNTAVGISSLYSNRTGSSNIAQGAYALYSNTTGSYNSAQGSNALYSNTTGLYNSAQGYASLYYNTTGSFNSAQGQSSLYSNTTGSYNSAQGYASLNSNTTGSYNSAQGQYSLYYNTSATNTTAVGYQAGRGTTDYSSQGGTYLGYQAGYSAGTGGDYNTLLGYQSGYNVSTGSYNIILGQNVNATSSNSVGGLNIGNVLFGIGMYTGGTVSATPVQGSAIGIGSTTPFAKLSVSGFAGGTMPLFAVSSSTASNATSTAFIIDSNGKVGVGTTTPQADFAVQGNSYFAGNVGVGTSSPESLLDVDGLGTFGTEGATTPQFVVKGGSGGADLIRLQRTSGVSLTYGWSLAGGALAFRDITLGSTNLSLLTNGSNPSLIIGDVRNSAGSVAGRNGLIYSEDADTAGTDIAGGDLTIASGRGLGSATPSNIIFQTPDLTISGATSQAWSTKLIIKGNGNVGIGTTSPYAKLSVVGETVSEYFTATSTTATSTFAGGLQAGGSTGLYVLQNGNVGVGTAAPGVKFEAVGGSSGTETVLAQIRSNFATANTASTLRFTNSTANSTYSGSAEITALRTSTPASGSSDLLFRTSGGTALNEIMRITGSGLVGIGTTSPTNRLGVSGGFIDVDGTTGGYKIDNRLILQASSTNGSLMVGQSAGNSISSTGTYNTMLGYEAGYNTSVGKNALYAGYRAGYYATSSVGSTYIGYEAGKGQTGTHQQGDYNTAVGYGALKSNTTGNSNASLGYLASALNTTGVNNNAIGYAALYSNTTGNNNAANGQGTLYYSKTGSNNVAMGSFASYNNISATGTVAIGNSAAFGATGHYSQGGTYVGTSAGYSAGIGGDWNTMLGYEAGYNTSVGKNALYAGYRAGYYATSSLYSTYLGYEAGRGNTGTHQMGDYNTAVGYQSLRVNTTGTQNAAFGPSLDANTTGSYNVAVGTNVLHSNTTGISNTAMGVSALYSNITGNYNNAQGNSALYYNTSATNTTAVGVSAARGTAAYSSQGGTYLGYQAGYSAGTGGDYNTMLGYEAGYNTSTGDNAVYAGYRAGYYATSSLYSTYLGYEAGRGDTGTHQMGDYNTAIGYKALNLNTSGEQNTAQGYLSLYSNTTGSYNTAIGVSSLRYSTTASYNSAYGHASLFNNTTGSYNSAQGAYALYSNTTGNYNFAAGYASLYTNTTGGNNTAIGHASLNSNITGSNNSTLGYYTLRYNTSATNTTAVGFQAGVGTANYSSQGGTYLGYQAGYSAGTGGDYNTLLGYQSGYNVSTGSYNIILGQNVNATSSNSVGGLNIGNVLFGTGMYSGATVSASPALGSAIGISSTSPYAKLSIHAPAGGTMNTLFAIGSSTASATTTLFTVLNNGNVGVGTASPIGKLDIGGYGASGFANNSTAFIANNVDAIAGLEMKNTNTGTGAEFRFGIFDTTGNYTAFTMPGVNNTGSNLLGQPRATTAFIFNAAGTSRNLAIGTYGAKDLIFSTNDIERVRILSNGNVGIGTTSPYAKLSVTNTAVGTTPLAVYGFNSQTAPLFLVASTTGSATSTAFIIDSNGKVGVGTTTPQADFAVQGNSYLAGNVGVGTAAPQTALHIHGSGSSYAFISVGNDSVNNSFTQIASANIAGQMSVRGSGNGGMLFRGFSSASSLPAMNFQGHVPSGASAPAVGFEGWKSSGSNRVAMSGTDKIAQFGAGDIYAGTASITMTVLAGGNVGIGTTSPFAKLSVTNTAVGTTPLAVYGFNSQTAPLFLVASTTGSATSTAFIIDSNGKVGVGTTTPWTQFGVTGRVSFDGLTGATGAGSICLDANKELVYNAGSDACLPSLRDTKHDINNLALDGMSLMRSINPVSFIYNAGDGRTRYGFIAEDISEIDSHLATYNDKGELSGIDDRALIALSVGAIKNLDLRLSEIEAKIASSTPSFGAGTSSNDSGIIASIVSFFESLGVKISQGLAEFKKVVVEAFTVGSSSQPAGITLFDEETGAPYCFKMKGGVATTTPGACVAEGGSSQQTTDNGGGNGGGGVGGGEQTALPTIILVGNNPAEISIGTTYVDLGATALDGSGQSLMPDMISNNVDTSRVGEYEVVWEVHDSALNYASSTRRVIVSDPFASVATSTSESIPEEAPVSEPVSAPAEPIPTEPAPEQQAPIVESESTPAPLQ